MKNNIPLQKKKTQTKETSSGFDSSISYDFCFRLGWILFLGSEVKKTKEAKTPHQNKQTKLSGKELSNVKQGGTVAFFSFGKIKHI